METITCMQLPRNPRTDVVYKLVPKNYTESFYLERTNRNIGWITKEEQLLLQKCIVGIAGCGGMGGLISSTLLRCGIGEVRIADTEVFDVSNLNRQYAATMKTIGKSKAFETARLLRTICPDATIVVYPQGITEATAEMFVSGCHIICDEIELWALGARILLHQAVRKHGCIALNCSTVGHKVNMTKFTATSMTIEEVVAMEYPEAMALQQKIQQGTASKSEVDALMAAVLRFAAPEMPEYSADFSTYSTVEAVHNRLKQGTASIIATNPPMASGFLSNQVLFHLLQSVSSIKRRFVTPPLMPGYLSFDAALMESKQVEGKWWNN